MKIKRHIGSLSSGTRCYVVYTQVPDEPEYCLIVEPDSLPERFAFGVRDTVEGIGQSKENLYDALYTERFHNGQGMLNALHNGGYLRKVRTDEVTMHVSNSQNIKLNKLLELINEQKPQENKEPEQVISDDQMANTLVAEAIASIKEGYEKLKRAKNMDPNVVVPSIEDEQKFIYDDKTSENEVQVSFKYNKGLSKTKVVQLFRDQLGKVM